MEAEELHGQTAFEEVAKSSDNPAKSVDNPAKSDTPAKSGDNPAKSDTPAKSGDNPAKSDTPAKSGDNSAKSDTRAKSGDNPAKSGDNPAKSDDNLSDPASISTEGVSSLKEHDSMGGSCAEVSSAAKAVGMRTITPASSSSQTFAAFVPSVSGLANSTCGPQVTVARTGTSTTSTTPPVAASVTSAITVPRPTTTASSQPNLSKVMVGRNGKRWLLLRNGNRWLCNGYHGEYKFSTDLLPLFKAHILNHLHEDNEPCQHPSASQTGELSQTCPHVEQVINSFTDEKTDRPPSSSAIPNQDRKDTASGSSCSTEPSPAIQKAEDDGSDSDCEVIEVAKKEAPFIDLTEDDPPESSEKAGISSDHSSTTSEPELRTGTSFSLRSNENVSADQTIPNNEANTTGANTTQPGKRRPNTPMPNGQGVHPEQDDQRKSMFYVCGFADCMFSCNLSEQFKHHILNNHRGADVFPCAHCAYRSPGLDELFRHMNSHTATKMFLLYKCGFSGCRFGTNLLSEFTQHNQIFHKAEDWYGCVTCKNKFVSLEELLKHLQTSVLNFIQCPHCTVKDKERRIILQHITECHPGKPRQITVTYQLICKAPNLPFRRARGDSSKNKSSSGRPKSSGASSSAKEANKQSSSQDLTSKGMEKRESETIRSKSNPTCPQGQILSDSFGKVEQDKSSKQLEGHVRTESRSPDSTSLENVCLYSCPSCKKSFIRYQVMEKHIIQCHPEATEIVLYKCKNCPFSSTSLNSTETHWTKIHCGTSQIFHQKRIIGQSLTQESRPSELHQAVDFLHCDHCSFTCNNREEFMKHELSHDPETEESHAAQNVTELSPSNEGVFQLPPGSFYNTAVKCPHCKYTSKARVSLLRHVKLHQSWKDQNSEGSSETLHGKQIPVAEGRIAAISSTSETSILAGNIDKVASTKTGKYDINPAGKSPSSGLTFYKCKFCSFKSPNLEGFNEHLRTHRSKTHFKCENCSFKCNNSTNMFKHQKKEHVGMSLKYKEVDTSTGNESLIENPNPKTSKRKNTLEVLEVSKKQRTGQCDNESTFCGVVASSITSLEEHFKKIHGVKAFTCDKCRYITYELPLMEKHFADAHQQQKVVYKMSPSTPSKSQRKASNVHEQKCYRCGLCSVFTPTEDGFNEHSQYKHSSEQPHLIPITVYTCDYGSTRFKFLASAEHATSCDRGAVKESVDTVAESNSKVHTTPSHSQQGLRQEEAGKQVSPSHSETKKSNYKYPCQKCDYSTIYRARIRTHYYRHNNYRPYKCSYCAYCSNRSDKVPKHMSSKHPEEKINIKVVKDEQIEMTIDLLISEHRISLKRSEQTPSPAPTAGSPTDFAESETKSVNDNAVKSTSQKHFDPSNPLNCNLCNFTTASKQSLHLHIQRQHDPLRLTCTDCDFKTTYPYQLVDHVYTHFPRYSQYIHCQYRAYPSSAVSTDLKSNRDGPRKLKFYKNKELLEYNKVLEGLGKPPYEIPEPKKIEPPSIDEFQDVPHKKKKKNKTKRSARVLWSDSESDSDQAPSVPSVPKATTFCCHLCKYKAKDLNQFAEHLSVHKAFMNSGRKEVSKCGFCLFTSSDPIEFNEHVERHVSERPFRCSHCGYACFSKAQFRNHIKCKHPGKKVNYTDRSDENTVQVRGPTPEPTSVNFNVKVHLVDIWCLPMKQFDEMVLSNGLGSANLAILSHEMFLDLY